MRIKLSPLSTCQGKGSLLLALTLITFLTASTGCTVARHHRSEEQTQETGVAPPVDLSGDGEIIQAQNQQQSKVEVTFTARVERLLPPDTRGNPHQKFILQLSNGTTILVAHNTKLAPEVPIQVGDMVTMHGEYVWNKKGGLVHYTHHSTNRRHQSGWILLNGQRYE